MKTHQKNWALAIILGSTVLATSALAAGEQKITLKAEKAGQEARGQVVITDGKAGQKEIAISMTGLKPNSVYTVWLVNMKPKMDMLGVGTGDYSFKSDGKGTGSYAAAISNAELEKWEMLEIVYHPDGNAKDMKKMQIALNGSVKMMKMKR
jgi:hypothetical protein